MFPIFVLQRTWREGSRGEADPNGVNLLFFIFYEIVLFCFSKSDLSDENIKGDVVKVYWLA